MAKGFDKGKSGNPNGKPKGAVNKFTATVKDVFTNVFTELQEDSEVNLKSWGKNNPTDFYKLCAKLIPTAVDVTSKGDKLQNFDLKDAINKFYEGDTKAETSTS